MEYTWVKINYKLQMIVYIQVNNIVQNMIKNKKLKII